ncbi:hypothetical protein AGLY_017739 [Aphis glycines]|uniref:Uncharacterized protein n=1 Tax=Aphis glycines TaxID=307491 RepID=A0A6G0SW19_APHGL|nr:hypothetical protein AGLY_017739 [Aphis glycines]
MERFPNFTAKHFLMTYFFLFCVSKYSQQGTAKNNVWEPQLQNNQTFFSHKYHGHFKLLLSTFGFSLVGVSVDIQISKCWVNLICYLIETSDHSLLIWNLFQNHHEELCLLEDSILFDIRLFWSSGFFFQPITFRLFNFNKNSIAISLMIRPPIIIWPWCTIHTPFYISIKWLIILTRSITLPPMCFCQLLHLSVRNKYACIISCNSVSTKSFRGLSFKSGSLRLMEQNPF